MNYSVYNFESNEFLWFKLITGFIEYVYVVLDLKKTKREIRIAWVRLS